MGGSAGAGWPPAVKGGSADRGALRGSAAGGTSRSADEAPVGPAASGGGAPGVGAVIGAGGSNGGDPTTGGGDGLTVEGDDAPRADPPGRDPLDDGDLPGCEPLGDCDDATGAPGTGVDVPPGTGEGEPGTGDGEASAGSVGCRRGERRRPRGRAPPPAAEVPPVCPAVGSAAD